MTPIVDPDLQCLDGHDASDPCKGVVEYRTALSATGRSFPRCAKHWEKRLDTDERHRQEYPDSPIAPAWFDPANAGETWNDDY